MSSIIMQLCHVLVMSSCIPHRVIMMCRVLVLCDHTVSSCRVMSCHLISPLCVTTPCHDVVLSRHVIMSAVRPSGALGRPRGAGRPDEDEADRLRRRPDQLGEDDGQLIRAQRPQPHQVHLRVSHTHNTLNRTKYI